MTFFFFLTKRIALSLDKFHLETENKDDPAEDDRMLDPRGNIPYPPLL